MPILLDNKRYQEALKRAKLQAIKRLKKELKSYGIDCNNLIIKRKKYGRKKV